MLDIVEFIEIYLTQFCVLLCKNTIIVHGMWFYIPEDYIIVISSGFNTTFVYEWMDQKYILNQSAMTFDILTLIFDASLMITLPAESVTL